MNWAEEPDPAAGDEASYEPDPGMDDASFDEPSADEVGDYDADADADGDGDDDETGAQGDTGETTDDTAPGDDLDSTGGEPDADADLTDDDGDDTVQAETIEITDDEVVGTDPDADPAADDPAFDAEFPPDIDLDARPEPVDGEPWSDANLLGSTADTGTDWATYDYAPPMDDLFAMDGASTGDWGSLTGSDDPAVSSLARWWQPT